MARLNTIKAGGDRQTRLRVGIRTMTRFLNQWKVYTCCFLIIDTNLRHLSRVRCLPSRSSILTQRLG
jgi:hypothetical protein